MFSRRVIKTTLRDSQRLEQRFWLISSKVIKVYDCAKIPNMLVKFIFHYCHNRKCGKYFGKVGFKVAWLAWSKDWVEFSYCH